MLGHFDMIAIIVVLLGIVFAGVHIAIALGITAALGLYLMTSDLEVVRTFVANTAYEALRDYVFAVIPLFMLMGDFLAKCGAARGASGSRNHCGERAVRIRDRRQHRRRRRILAHRLSGDAALRLPPRFCTRLRSRQRLPWHVDTAVGLNDRLVRVD